MPCAGRWVQRSPSDTRRFALRWPERSRRSSDTQRISCSSILISALVLDVSIGRAGKRHSAQRQKLNYFELWPRRACASSQLVRSAARALCSAQQLTALAWRKPLKWMCFAALSASCVKGALTGITKPFPNSNMANTRGEGWAHSELREPRGERRRMLKREPIFIQTNRCKLHIRVNR